MAAMDTRKTTSPCGLEIIKSFEGICDGNPKTVNLDPYKDPVGIWTIGWGHVLRYQGRILKGDADKALANSIYPGGISMPQAERLLVNDVSAVEIYLNAVFPYLTQNQFDALVSFCFNVGIHEESTLFTLLKAKNFAGAAGQFGRWIYSAGQVLPGLIKRRAAERALFMAPNKER